MNIRAIGGLAASAVLLSLGCGHKNDFVPLNGAGLRASTPRTIRAPMVAPAKFDGKAIKGAWGIAVAGATMGGAVGGAMVGAAAAAMAGDHDVAGDGINDSGQIH